VAEAGRIAGYGTRQATHLAMKSIRRNAVDILDEIGYGQKKAIEDLREMANRKLVKHFAKDGIVLSSKIDEDNDIQFRARVELNKMHGHYPTGSNDANSVGAEGHSGHSVCILVSDAAAAKAFAKLFAPRGTTGIALDVDAQVDENLG